VLFPPSAPFDVAAGVLLEIAAYWGAVDPRHRGSESGRRRPDDPDARRPGLSFAVGRRRRPTRRGRSVSRSRPA
jgi:hypothetical protein